MTKPNDDDVKPLIWMGSSAKDLRDFPPPVKRDIGSALFSAQKGRKPNCAKPLKGFNGAGVLEVVDDHDGNTYRAVYTVRFVTVVYVLHAFQKKAKRGIETPKHDLDIIQARLKSAEDDHRRRMKKL